MVIGEKHFTLLPPIVMHRLYILKYPSTCYTKNDAEFSLQNDDPHPFVLWASVDHYPPPSEVFIAKSKFVSISMILNSNTATASEWSL